MNTTLNFKDITFPVSVGENAIFRGTEKEFKEAVKQFEETIKDILEERFNFLEVVKDDAGNYDITIAYGGPNIYLTIAYGFILFTYVWGNTRMVIHLEGYYLGEVVKEKIEENF